MCSLPFAAYRRAVPAQPGTLHAMLMLVFMLKCMHMCVWQGRRRQGVAARVAVEKVW